ncbi:MDR family MFS transporter [Formosa sp. S-31]|uniref:MDR family MFS transporter n=1 Tax=Formosa sp. S-31 TaxID=2790949 RepID=UPI003EBC053C
MQALLNQYINTFKGLSREVWWLALITLINRAGTMVVPFLSLYLTKNLDFSLKEVGWIMSAFGLGSVVGSWIGGKLTDKIGYYKIMVFSLICSGFLFIGVQYLNSFESLIFGIFLLLLVADMFRPAMFVALSSYSKPENKVRSITLIRLAINLGFSAGPALGGLIISTVSYGGLFWVDGITCIIAGILLLKVLNPKIAKVTNQIKIDNPKSAYSDYLYLIFLLAMLLFGVAFLQYFSTIPLYYKEVHNLSEFQIGLLMGLNGITIFLLEMPLVKILEKSTHSKMGLVIFGALLTLISFIILNFTSWTGILIAGMLFMTIGEMIAFPFSNAFALSRAEKGNQGEYMALYSISFSIAHIIGHNSGMQTINAFGYETTWYLISVVMLVCLLILWALKKKILMEKI